MRCKDLTDVLRIQVKLLFGMCGCVGPLPIAVAASAHTQTGAQPFTYTAPAWQQPRSELPSRSCVSSADTNLLKPAERPSQGRTLSRERRKKHTPTQ
jgi:L-alanine-DL-glutamate epimerase-like enolase superfamily enzyme